MSVVVLVTGPWLAGSTSLVAALRRRLPDRVFVEGGEHPAPAAAIFVASAAAPLTESDCALLDAAAAGTDLVIGAVSKIDVYRGWGEVLAADAGIAADRDPRFAGMTWLGVAAAPLRGEPRLDELVEALEKGLARPTLARRNQLRVRQSRLRQAMRDHESARLTALRRERTEVLRRHRLAATAGAAGLRGRVAQVRVDAAYVVRNRCASVRGELAQAASTVVRHQVAAFEDHLARRVDEVVTQVYDEVSEQLADLSAEFGLTAPVHDRPPDRPSVSGPPLSRDNLETRLMMMLGAVLGVGVALTLSRLAADMARPYTLAGVAAGAAVGLGVAVWVFGVRRTLRDRAVLDRWVTDVLNELRAALEQQVVTRVLHTESALGAALARRRDAQAATVADRLGAIDDELRELAAAAARRDREMPAWERALAEVNRELNRSCE